MVFNWKICVYHLLLLFPLPSHIFFQNLELLAALAISLNCDYNFANSTQNSGCACTQVFYISCYIMRLTNVFQYSWLELRMPCHTLFSLLSTCRTWFGSVRSSGFGLVWHFTHEFLITSHIQAPDVQKKNHVLYMSKQGITEWYNDS
jgi:hypothetical protein